MSQSTELLPCPFCEAKLVEAEPASNYYSHPGGNKCLLDGFDMDVDGDPSLAVRWNTRATTDAEILRLETLLADKTVEAADLAHRLRLAGKRESKHIDYQRLA